MKKIIYDFFGTAYLHFMRMLTKMLNLTLQAHKALLESIVSVFGALGRAVLWVIDKERTSVATAQVDQQSIIVEFECISKIRTIRAKFLQTEEWDDKDTNLLNLLTYRLVAECGWTQDSAFEFINEVIGSLPGIVIENPYD